MSTDMLRRLTNCRFIIIIIINRCIENALLSVSAKKYFKKSVNILMKS